MGIKTVYRNVQKSCSFICQSNSTFFNKINGWGTRARTSISGVRGRISYSIVCKFRSLHSAISVQFSTLIKSRASVAVAGDIFLFIIPSSYPSSPWPHRQRNPSLPSCKFYSSSRLMSGQGCAAVHADSSRIRPPRWRRYAARCDD